MGIFDVRPGEEIDLHDGVHGIVLINFELSLFASGYEPGGWSDEEGGLLVSASAEGLVRYPRDGLLANLNYYEE